MKKEAKRRFRNITLIFVLSGVIILFILNAFYFLNQKSTQSDVRDYKDDNLILIISFKKSSYSYSNDSFANGELVLKNVGPSNINITNDFFINLSGPDNTTRVRWLDHNHHQLNLNEYIVLESGGVIDIYFGLLINNTYRAHPQLWQEGKYSVQIQYDDYESNIVEITLDRDGN